MNIEIKTGVKAYWLGALILLIGIGAGLKFIGGLVRIERDDRLNILDSIDGLIVFAICFGWWFAE
jgi:hypothetical protein